MPDTAILATRAVAGEPVTLDSEARTVDVVWTTGARARNWVPGLGDIIEELDLSPNAVRMGVLQGGAAPVLDDHMRGGARSVMGIVAAARLETARGVATLQFSRAADVDAVWQRVQDRTLRFVSVGYRVYRYHQFTDPATDAVVYRAVDWEPYEISIAPFPVDAGAVVRGRAGDPAAETTTVPPGVITMVDTTAAAGPTVTQPVVTQPASSEGQRSASELATIQAEAERAVTDRIRAHNEVFEVARSYLSDDLIAPIRQQALSERLTVEALRARLWDASVAAQGPTGVSARREPTYPRVMNGQQDEITVFRSRAAGAIAARMADQRMADVPEEFREYAGVGLQGILREMLVKRGIQGVHRLDGYRLWTEVVRSATHTTSDFPIILKDAANKRLMQKFMEFPATWEPWTQEIDVADFKAINVANIGEMPTLDKVSEGGPITRGTTSEEGESYNVETFAKAIQMTRKMIIDDDMRGFERLIAGMAEAGYRRLADNVYGILTTNAAMADTKALFSAEHNNVGAGASGTIYHYLIAGDRPSVEIAYLDGRRAPEVTSEETFDYLGISYRVVFDFGAKAVSWRGMARERAAVTEASVAALEELLVKQKTVAGNFMAVPRNLILLIPPSQSVVARKLATATTPASAADINIFAGRLQVIMDPRLS